jgi:hypothetical protein
MLYLYVGTKKSSDSYVIQLLSNCDWSKQHKYKWVTTHKHYMSQLCCREMSKPINVTFIPVTMGHKVFTPNIYKLQEKLAELTCKLPLLQE